MNKSEKRELEFAKMSIALGEPEIAARTVSILIRSTISKKTVDEFIAFARENNLTKYFTMINRAPVVL